MGGGDSSISLPGRLPPNHTPTTYQPHQPTNARPSMLAYLFRWIVFLVVVYYSAKAVVALVVLPLLKPFGVTVASVGLVSGVTGFSFEPAQSKIKPTQKAALLSLSVRNIRVGFLLSQRKLSITISGLRVRVRLLVSSASAAAKLPQTRFTNTNVKGMVDTYVTNLLRTLKGSAWAVRGLQLLGLVEIYVLGIDVLIIDEISAPVLRLSDPSASIFLKTDTVELVSDSNGTSPQTIAPESNSPTSNPTPAFSDTIKPVESPTITPPPASKLHLHSTFLLTVEASQFLVTAGTKESSKEAELIRLTEPTTLRVQTNIHSGDHSITLALPPVYVKSAHVLQYCMSKFKAPKPSREDEDLIGDDVPDLAALLTREYEINKDYYISLLRHSFLATIHDFRPTVNVTLSKIVVQAPATPFVGFAEFDLDVPGMAAKLEHLALTLQLRSKVGDDGARILWVESTLSVHSINLDAELVPGRRVCVVSVPRLHVRANSSVPVFSMTQTRKGMLTLRAEAARVQVVLPSRLFVVLQVLITLGRDKRGPPRAGSYERFRGWVELVLRLYEVELDVTLDLPVVGFRMAGYKGYDETRDAVVSVSGEQIRFVSDSADAGKKVEKGADVRLLDVQVLMTPLSVDAYTEVLQGGNRTPPSGGTPPSSRISRISRVFPAAVVQGPLVTLVHITDSRSLVTVSLTPTHLLVHIDAVFSQITADLTCTTPTDEAVVDFFAVSVFVAQLIQKVILIRGAYPRAALAVPGVPVVYTFCVRTPRAVLAASETLACGLVVTAGDVRFEGEIAADLSQTFRAETTRNVVVEALAGLTKAGGEGKEVACGSREVVAVADRLVLSFYKGMGPEAIDVLPALKLEFPTLGINFNFRKFYVCFTSYLPILKMTKIINAREGGPTGVDMDLKIDTCNLMAEFSSGTKLEALIQSIKFKLNGTQGGEGTISTLSLRTPDNSDVWHQVLTSSALALEFRKTVHPATGEDKMIISILASEAHATNPYAYEFSDLFEDIINIQKAIKAIIFERMGLVSMARLTVGKTLFKESEMPEYRVAVDKVSFEIMDDPFESKLARNYREGFEEQFGRIARGKAFQKKAVPMRDQNGGVITGVIEDAFWAIHEYNSKSWIRRIFRAKKEFPPLLRATLSKLNVVVTSPTLPGASIEESIHFIDAETPVAVEYDDLIARNILATVDDVCLQLRDYPVPLVRIPSNGSLETPTWKTEGLLIIADLLASSESKRKVTLGLEPVEVPGITVTRNLCPVKIYAQSETSINVSVKYPLFLSWGMCVEPPLADMIRVLDTFTKVTVDPSPPVGWWDKMRHMVHLGRTVFKIGPGDFKLRILGSMTPYYDARFHYGTEGIDITFGHGARIELSATSPNENVVIECGRTTFSLPNSEHEQGRISGAHRAEIKDEIFAQFCGGVRVAAGIRFTTLDENKLEISPWKTHSEVVLKLPEYALAEDNTIFDSYHGFRSKLIHVVYDIQSPHARYSSKTPPSNFLSFTNDSYYRFCALIPVYQSPLAIIPIRRGPLFEKNIQANVEKPKLGRSIKTNHLKGSFFPLILSYLCEFEDATGGVGLRFGAKRMDFDVVFEQKNVVIIKEGFSEASNVSKWLLQTASIEFAEVEGRTLSFSSERSGAENKYRAKGTEKVADHKEWFLDIDYNFVMTHSGLDMVPFVWSPKVKYFKRNQGSEFTMEHKHHSEAEVHKDQISLYNGRLEEINEAIAHYIESQKALQDRILLTNDDSLNRASEILVDKLTVLFEKKQAIERHIRNSVKHVNEVHKQFAKAESNESIDNEAMFDHHYVIHNINFLWRKEVRNICLRFFDLIYRESSLYYCLSNAALKTAKELLNASIKESITKKGRRTFDPESGIMGDFDSKASGELLELLLNDTENIVVSCEDEETQDFSTNATSGGRDSKTDTADLMTYKPSDDPESPDFVAPNMCVNAGYIIQLVNPQVNFESAPKGKSDSYHSVVMVAETMQLRSVGILESEIPGSLANLDEIQRRNEDLVKNRTILNVQHAQFFTCSFEDARNENYSNPFVLHHGPTSSSEKGVKAKRSFWPMWVPLENVMWNDFEMDSSLQRVVGRTSASFYRDKPNPLYVRRNSSTTKSDFTDTYFVDFPDFKIEANSKQFFIIQDIVTNLLMYHDPTSGERRKKLRKMMLALDQMPNLAVVFDSVLVLQNRIRQGSKLLKFGRKMQDRNHASHWKLHTVLNSSQCGDIRLRLLQFQEEIHVIMEALKALSILEQKKNSLEVALQLNINAKNLVWTMMQDAKVIGEKAQPLAQWTLTNTRFLWVQNEDQSSLNTLEIDKVYLENLLPNGVYKNMISPHGDTRGVDFRKRKMVRVYWKEMAPVAGIMVIEHFEVNLYPLLLQISRETGRAAEKYFFPKSKKEEDRGDELGAIDSPEKERRVNVATAVTSRKKKEKASELSEPYDEFKEMQLRAAENRSFVYIKVPTLQLCLSYKGLREKNIEDLHMFTFLMPTMEYRNKTWSWQDVFAALKKDAIKAVLHNSGALVREKLFTKNTKAIENELVLSGSGARPETAAATERDGQNEAESKKGRGLFSFGGTSAKK
ncbi:golgi-body localization protein domain-containing protein [Chytriomyces sp. MP71]|nr:golgi-body localization protein domain-containing protein [Chytriomyces sp. MP71]